MKLKEFQSELQKQNISAALLFCGETPNSGFTYFTQLSKLTHAALLIPVRGKQTLFISILDKVKGEHVVQLKEPLFDKLKKYEFATIGIDFTTIPHAVVKKLKKECNSKLKDISSILQRLRTIKTEDELKLIKKASEISNKAFNHIIGHFHFKTETEVAAALGYELAKRGASPSFTTIVASGKNASVPHHRSENKPLQKGFCVIDFGANYNGYCSDCTRTIYIGKPSQKEKDIYNLVLAAQENALNAVRPNLSCKKLDTVARNALGQYKKYFTHALGHGIGIDVHESPTISQKSKDKLQKNMVITIEPGIYIPNKLGIRIEDMVIVGGNILTNISKELRIIKKL